MKYHILSLDGGGAWALIQVKTLIKLYGANTRGHVVLKHFDLVAANSGGSIVAAALIEDFTLAEILALFTSEPQRRAIFSELPWYKKLNPLSLFLPLPRFSTAQKYQALLAAFTQYGSKWLRDIQIMGKNNQPILFMFVSYDYDRDRAKFFRSWPSLAGAVTSPYVDTSLVDAVHASSNAPIQFFDQPAQIAGGQYWDGGLTGYNNPVLAAAAEAIAANWKKEQIAILSIGTGNTMLPLLNTRKNNESSTLFKEQQISSIQNDIKKVAATILADPPDSHTFLAHLLMGGRLPLAMDECPIIDSGLIRLNPLIQARGNSHEGWVLPDGFDEVQFKRLINLDMAVIAQADIDLIVHFCELWMQNKVHNQAIRAGKDFICEIGFARFSDAIEKWQSYTLTPLTGQHHDHSRQLL
ncbi:patatin-like phospholipase family protein [Janthinobacterium sp. B9-8]|uniref:patatin-like phospholipase family protein n=1 Tax=Janthinobacterium sp. B9-8 TaxID=1236179 RepID=UPI00061CEF1E|nr:patatin-like phospholipase family protein [Janthinobacterium sp. B9-8]AMC34288.1 hypothetical protein VN23_06585 [Janthinobacterium sp. B9-8]